MIGSEKMGSYTDLLKKLLNDWKQQGKEFFDQNGIPYTEKEINENLLVHIKKLLEEDE